MKYVCWCARRLHEIAGGVQARIRKHLRVLPHVYSALSTT
jgi:hypothetical protein